MNLSLKSTWLRWVERFALAALILHFSTRPLPRAWNSLITDFPNYYLAADLAHRGIDASRMFEWDWFERQKDHQAIPIRVIGLVPITPFSTLFVWPLTGLKPLGAKRAWILLSLALLIPLSWMLHQMTRLSYQRLALIFAMSVPLYRNIEFGQFYIVLLCLLVAACWSYLRKWYALSGALIALAAAAKIFPLILLVFFLQRRAWRALAAAAIVGSATIALSIGAFGWNVHRTYLSEILPAALHGEAMPPYKATASLSGLLHVLFLSEPQWNPRPWHPSVAAFSILLPILSMLLLAPAILLIRKNDKSNNRILLEWSALLTASLATSTMPASYTFVLMAFPACVLWTALREQKRHICLAALSVAYVGIGTIPQRLPLVVAILVGIYAMLWARPAATERDNRDWTRYAWAVGIVVAIAANIHSTWLRESGVRKEFAYRLPIEPQGYINAYPRSEAGTLRYISFTLDGYHLVTIDPVSGAKTLAANPDDDDLSYTSGNGRLLVERATAKGSAIVDPTALVPPVLENAEDPVLSARGDSIAFLRDNHGREQLMTRSLSGSSEQQERALTPASFNVYEATFLSDSEYAFSASDGVRAPQIYLTDRTHTNAPTGLGASRYPSLSPDGAWLAYSRLQGGVWNLWIRDQHSSSTRRICDVPCNEIQPSWLPDSKTILYSTDCGRNLWFTAIARRKVIP